MGGAGFEMDVPVIHAADGLYPVPNVVHEIAQKRIHHNFEKIETE